jgi:hypothetical protein
VLRPYETVQVQVIEEGDHERRTHFCNKFLQAVHVSVIYPKHTFFTNEAWFHLNGCIDIQNYRSLVASSKKQRKLFLGTKEIWVIHSHKILQFNSG